MIGSTTGVLSAWLPRRRGRGDLRLGPDGGHRRGLRADRSGRGRRGRLHRVTGRWEWGSGSAALQLAAGRRVGDRRRRCAGDRPVRPALGPAVLRPGGAGGDRPQLGRPRHAGHRQPRPGDGPGRRAGPPHRVAGGRPALGRRSALPVPALRPAGPGDRRGLPGGGPGRPGRGGGPDRVQGPHGQRPHPGRPAARSGPNWPAARPHSGRRGPTSSARSTRCGPGPRPGRTCSGGVPPRRTGPR